MNRNTFPSHTSQSMSDSSLSQTGPVWTFSVTRQWSFFLSPCFSFLLFLTESPFETFFHPVPIHSNEPTVFENIQPSRGEKEEKALKNLTLATGVCHLNGIQCINLCVCVCVSDSSKITPLNYAQSYSRNPPWDFSCPSLSNSCYMKLETRQRQ